jgi:uncharacterized membrane protein
MMQEKATSRFSALDQVRGLAVFLIHFVDVFYLLWDSAKGLDWYGAFIIDSFPVYAIPPILFAFSTGVSLTFWRQRHPELRYLFNRCGLLLLSGFILSYYVDGSIEAWGLFELIAFINLVIFFLHTPQRAAAGLIITLSLNSEKPPFYSFSFPEVPYFFSGFEMLPRMVSRSLVSGLFPLVPFLTWGLWGVIIGSIKKNPRKLLVSGSSMIILGLFSRFFSLLPIASMETCTAVP